MIKFDHMGIKARDIDKSVKFYSEIFGFEIKERLQLVGHEFLFMGFIGDDVSVIEIEQAGEKDTAQDVNSTAGMGHFAFVVDNMDEIMERVEKFGAKVVIPPIQLREDRRIAYIEDPDGSRVQMIEFVK